MYFKTLKTSETGAKFSEIEQRMREAFEAQKTMAEKYGIKEWRRGYWTVSGRFSSVRFEQTPDPKLWKVVQGENEYMPKLSSKAGKAIQAEFDKMPCVKPSALNECVGIDANQWGNVGVSFRNPELVGFSVPEQWEFTCPPDCVEITTSEYVKLFGKPNEG